MKKAMSKAGMLLAAGLILLSSCSKVPGSFDDVTVDVNPSPLEVHGGMIDATISATFPEKYVPKKAVIEITPVLIYNGGELAGKTFKVQGEKAEANNKVITELGGSVSEKVSFVYSEEMRLSELVIRAKVIVGKKEKVLPDYKIADGVIATSQLVDYEGGMAILGKSGFERVTFETKEAAIKFAIQQSTIRSSEMKKDEMVAMKEYLKSISDTDNVTIENLNISAYASPDGPTDLNEKVAAGRETSSQKYLQRELKRSKIELDDDKFLAQATPEDWEGFKVLMEASDIQDKDLILRVLSMYDDPAVREKEIKNLSSAFAEIKETILPELRRAKMTLNTSVMGKSDEMISELAANRPYRLSVIELLYAAELSDDSATKLEIYKNATSFYPEDWRGFNNMGYVYYNDVNIKEAELSFAKANNVKSDQPEIINNLGVMALTGANYSVAEQYFGRAAGAGPELDYNLGIINLQKTDYGVADQKFAGYNTNNAGLTKILLKDYSSALDILSKVESPDGLTYYLHAVAAARTNDKDAVMESLKKAIDMDAELAKKAGTDAEFMAYFMEDDFKALMQ